jgi:hypothetical protein
MDTKLHLHPTIIMHHHHTIPPPPPPWARMADIIRRRLRQSAVWPKQSLDERMCLLVKDGKAIKSAETI